MFYGFPNIFVVYHVSIALLFITAFYVFLKTKNPKRDQFPYFSSLFSPLSFFHSIHPLIISFKSFLVIKAFYFRERCTNAQAWTSCAPDAVRLARTHKTSETSTFVKNLCLVKNKKPSYPPVFS